MQPEEIPGILAGCDRSQAGPTLPAKGLFLKCVEYLLWIFSTSPHHKHPNFPFPN
jgi:hypothetical protein